MISGPLRIKNRMVRRHKKKMQLRCKSSQVMAISKRKLKIINMLRNKTNFRHPPYLTHSKMYGKILKMHGDYASVWSLST